MQLAEAGPNVSRGMPHILSGNTVPEFRGTIPQAGHNAPTPYTVPDLDYAQFLLQLTDRFIQHIDYEVNFILVYRQRRAE